MSEKKATDTIGANQKHPKIETIMDALTFQISRFAAINDRDGSVIFRDAFDLRLNEWRVLGLVNALQPASFHQLRAVLLMDKGQLSRVIKELVTRGLITSTALPSDARQIVLEMTQDGQALHDRALSFTAERNEEVVAPLTAEECTEFMRLLSRIADYNERIVLGTGNLK